MYVYQWLYCLIWLFNCSPNIIIYNQKKKTFLFAKFIQLITLNCHYIIDLINLVYFCFCVYIVISAVYVNIYICDILGEYKYMCYIEIHIKKSILPKRITWQFRHRYRKHNNKLLLVVSLMVELLLFYYLFS